MNTRIQALKEQLVGVTPEVSIERAVLVTQAHQRHEAHPPVMKRALALKHILERMAIYIEDDQLLAGNQGHKPRSAPIFPEYSWDWVIDEIDEIEQRPSDRFMFTDDAKEKLRAVVPYWQGRTVKDQAVVRQPEVVKQATNLGVIEWEGNVTAGNGHITVDYPAVLKRGVDGILREVRGYMENLDPTDPRNLRKQEFLRAVVTVMEAVVSFSERYASLVEEEAKRQSSTRRREELEHLAEVCRRVPRFPAKSFHEAVQSLWFVHLILQIESNGHSISLGRVDQYLFPYYRHDMETGTLDRPQALELIECLFLKLFSINKIRPWSHTQVVAGYPTYQNVCVGGQTGDGQDATNDLSFLCLDALGELRLPEPNFYVRYHEKCPPVFLVKCCEIVRMGFGMPALVNDEVIIPALMGRGVSLEDAFNYATMGCLEVSVPGKWGYRANGKSKFNLLKVLELSLNDGRDPNTGVQLCPGNGDLTTFASFEDVIRAWRTQLDFYTRLQIIADNINSLVMEDLAPDVLCSALVQDCIARGKTILEGGAIYDMESGAQIGVPNVGNSLMAIKKLVFENQTLTGEELKKALDDDFTGPHGERIRQQLLNWSPKYGNDVDEVDLLTRAAYEPYCLDISRYKNTRFGRGPIGGNWMPSTVTISSNVPAGKKVGATPDGRRADEPAADGVSPVHGTETNGPTAIINSVAKLPTFLMTGGQLLNMRISQDSLQSPEQLDLLAGLVKTLFRRRGWHIQFNTISSRILRDAQKHPQEYADLVVRVAGYSALFTALDPDVQNDIIARSEHCVG